MLIFLNVRRLNTVSLKFRSNYGFVSAGSAFGVIKDSTERAAGRSFGVGNYPWMIIRGAGSVGGLGVVAAVAYFLQDEHGNATRIKSGLIALIVLCVITFCISLFSSNPIAESTTSSSTTTNVRLVWLLLRFYPIRSFRSFTYVMLQFFNEANFVWIASITHFSHVCLGLEYALLPLIVAIIFEYLGRVLCHFILMKLRLYDLREDNHKVRKRARRVSVGVCIFAKSVLLFLLPEISGGNARAVYGVVALVEVFGGMISHQLPVLYSHDPR